MTPCKVTVVHKNAEAQRLGVQKDWFIEQVNGQDVSTPNWDYAKIHSLIEEKAALLPES